MSSSSVTLALRDLTVAMGPRILLAGVDLTVGPATRLGLVGPNGSGKSTLLRTLAGLHLAESGEIRLAPPSSTVGYLPQETVARPGETVLDLLGRRTGVVSAQRELDAATEALPDAEAGADDRYAHALERWLALGAADLDSRAAEVAEDLGLPADLLGRAVADLSGGQKARAQLAALLLARFDVFLLDEPTNDLDLDGLDRLERFVTGLAGPVLLVSHDRAFLGRTITAVGEIDAPTASLTRYDGGWTAYLDERDRARQHAEDDYRVYVERRDGLVDRARRQREWSQKGARAAKRSGERDKFIRFGHKEGAQNSGAGARQLDREMARLDVVDKPWEGWDLRLQIRDTARSGDRVAALTDAVVVLDSAQPGGAGPTRSDGGPAAGEMPGAAGVAAGPAGREPGSAGDGRSGQAASGAGFVLGPVSLEVRWGDRLAVVGANGSGKTTLLGALLGRVPLRSGERWLGPGVVVGEISQGRDEFAGAATLLHGFQRRSGLAAMSETRSLLAKFGLTADHVNRPPESLSPGERTRATLALLQAVGVNLLVLDEPTNHLDLPAIEQLEQAVSRFSGTLILVTHDRQLLDTVASTRVIEVQAGSVQQRSV